jgi:hypothetical protein
VDLHIRFWDALIERYIGQARLSLGDAVADHAWREGRALSFDEAIARAIADRDVTDASDNVTSLS